MAIELAAKKRPRTPLIFTIVGIVAVFLVLAFLGSYLYFYIVNKNLVGKIQQLRDSSSGLDKTIGDAETRLLIFQRSIDDFSFLILNHKNVAQVFNFIDENTIPTVFFSGFKIGEKEDNAVVVRGKTSSFFLIEQQISVFKKQDIMKDARLKEISIDEKEGAIKYSVILIFKPEIFVYKPLVEEEQPGNQE